MPSYGPGDHILGTLCRLWIEKIDKSRSFKKDQFQRDADEAQRFYRPEEGNYDWVYSPGPAWGPESPGPPMRMTLNKVAEVVQIFGPLLYSQNPTRQVNPRLPVEIPPSALPDPLLYQVVMGQEQARTDRDALKSVLLSAYLNWTPSELGLKEQADRAIDEALIKGRGVVWTGTYTPPGSTTRYVGSFYDSVDFLYIDPDSESLRDAWWIARLVCQPTWEVERRFGLEQGSLRGAHESANLQAEVDAQRRTMERQRGMTNDLVCYYEVWSRMGCGGRLAGSSRGRGDSGLLPGDLDRYADALDPHVGDFVYLAVARGVDYPLNLPPPVQEVPWTGDGTPADGLVQVRSRLAWPVPYWADNAWPCSVLDFHPVPRSAWPMSHIKPALGYLRFLCWAYSFMASKIKNTLRDVVAVLKEMSDQFKMTILEGADLSMVELDTQNRDIRECVQILQFPQMNADIMQIVSLVEEAFDKATGLNEVFYGKSHRQDRSATESDIKSQSMNIRPDDMARKVEAWMTEVARKEAVAARMLLAPRDVLPVLGVAATALWAQHVMSGDLSAFHELEYRIESGSTRKPNRDRDMANADSMAQIWLPIFNQFAMGTGQLGPINALISEYCKSRDIDPAPFILPAPPPMPSPPAGVPPGAPETASSGAGGPPQAPGGPS